MATTPASRMIPAALQAFDSNDLEAGKFLARVTSESQDSCLEFIKNNGVGRIVESLLPQLGTLLRHPATELQRLQLLLLRNIIQQGDEYCVTFSAEAGVLGIFVAVIMTESQSNEIQMIAVTSIHRLLMLDQSSKKDLYQSQLLQMDNIVPRLISFGTSTELFSNTLSWASLDCLAILSRNATVSKVLVNSNVLDFLFTKSADVDYKLAAGRVWRLILSFAEHSSLLRTSVAAAKEQFLIPLLKEESTTCSIEVLDSIMQVVELITTSSSASFPFFQSPEFLQVLKRYMVISKSHVVGVRLLQNVVVTDTDTARRVLQIGFGRLIIRKVNESGIILLSLLSHVASFVCRPQNSSDELTIEAVVVCALGFSTYSDVRTEAVWMLQLLSECPVTMEKLVRECPNLLGMLHVTKSKLLVLESDDDVISHQRRLVDSLLHVLEPRVESYQVEQQKSLIGLPELEVESTNLEMTLERVLEAKKAGNVYFKKGNYYAARLFYRHCVASIRVALANDRRVIISESDQDTVSIGCSVKVLLDNSSTWKDAMVSDVGENVVDVIYDATGDEEENVKMSRVRVQNEVMIKLAEVQKSCLLNTAKCFNKMHDLSGAYECLSTVLNSHPDDWEAHYLRGLVSLAIPHFQHAKEDLWRANQLRKKHSGIQAAWKRLQALVKRKKKLDKKLTKELLRYVSTLPGLDKI